MFNLKRKPLSMPDPSQALPGRPDAIPTATHHFITKAPLKGPYPQGAELALFGLGCFWGAERKFWTLPGVLVTAVGYAGGLTPIRPMRRCARDAPAIPRRCSSSSIRSA